MPTVLEKVVLGALRAPSYSLVVEDVEDVTEHLRRLRFSGPELLAAHEVTPAFWVRLWFPCDGEEYQRAYTVTCVHGDGAFAVQFVLHDGAGLATTWAREAVVGQSLRATVLGRSGSWCPTRRRVAICWLAMPRCVLRSTRSCGSFRLV